MKKFHTLAFVCLLCSLLCLGAFAFEMEKVESVGEMNVAAAQQTESSLSGELDITDPEVLNDPTYGTLIYYNDFDGYTLNRAGNITGGENYAGSVFDGNTLNINGGNATLEIVADPSDSTNQALKVTAVGGYARANFKPTTHVTATGFYTFVMDFYVPSDNSAAPIYGLVYINDNGNGHAAMSFGKNVLDGWATDRSCGYFRVVESGKESTSVSEGKGKCFDNVYLCDRRDTIDTGKYFYIDNLRMYYQPAITVSYDLNLPEGVSKVYDVKASGKTWVAFTSTESFTSLGTAVPEIYAPGYTFLGWTDADGNYVDYIAANTTALTAQWTPVKPGLNALTGTVEPATFEKGDRQYFIFEENFVRQITDNDIQSTVSGNDSSRVLKASASAVRYVVFDFPVQMDNGRKYYITWGSYTDVNFAGMLGWFLNYYGSGKHVTLGMNSQYQANAAGKWYTHVQNTSGAATANAIYMQYKFADDKAVSGAMNVYFDNLGVYPYYKITYHFADGTTKNDWFIDPGVEKMSYTVSTTEKDVWNGEDDKVFVGWATTESASVAQSKVTLANEDIDMYPVWKESYLASNYTSAVSSNSIRTAKAFESVTLDDIGNTGASVAKTDSYTVKITGANYSGDITLNFTLEDGSTRTETLHLIGGTKWRPGLNTLTGTVSPLAMDDMTETEIEYALNLNGNRWKLGENPKTDGINSSSKAVYSTAQYATITNRNNWNPTIEVNRPLSYEYDVLSSNTVYTMINGSAGGTTGNIYADYYGGNAKNAWRHEKAYIDMINKTPTSNEGLPYPKAKDGILYMGHSGKTGEYGTINKDGTLQSGKNAYLYLDNIAYIPYYKITYVLADGEETYDYVLYASDGQTLLTQYTPNTSLLGAKRYKLAEDGDVYSADTPILLANADITLYAVTDGYGVTTDNKFSYREPSETVSAGIRFRANVSALVHADSDEFGFIVARTEKLGDEELKFNADSTNTAYSADGKNFTGKTDGGIKYTGAVNYNKDNKISILYGTDKDTNDTQFACVLVNLDKGYTSGGTTYENRYDVKFTVRPYVIIAGTTYYGDSVSKSYSEVTAANENA